MSQEWALARWREDAARNDPPFYTVEQRHGRRFVWLSVGGNAGWYAPQLDAIGNMIGIRSEAYPPPRTDETHKDRASLNFAFKLVGPRQRRKIEEAMGVSPWREFDFAVESRKHRNFG